MNKKPLFVTVLIGHKRKSGKDTFADFLVKYLDAMELKYDRTAFADPLKEAICSATGLSIDELNYNKNNDSVTRSRIINFSKYLTDTFENLWVKYVKERRESVKNNIDVFLVTDFRLNEEYDAMYTDDTSFVSIKIHRNDFTSDTRTETELDNFEFDIHVDNTKSYIGDNEELIEGRTLKDLDRAAKEIATILETMVINLHIGVNDREWLRKRKTILDDSIKA